MMIGCNGHRMTGVGRIQARVQCFMIGVTCFVIGLAALPTGSIGLLGPGGGRGRPFLLVKPGSESHSGQFLDVARYASKLDERATAHKHGN